jgi:hypothetical protein
LAWLIVNVDWPSHAAAQSRGESLAGSTFKIDLVTGPIVGPNRVIGLGGAYTALGYGIDNAIITPAAYAVRTHWDTRWVEFDVTLDLSPSVLRSVNFINSGSSNTVSSDFLFVAFGASVILGDVGFGAIVRTQDYLIGSYAKLSMVLANYGACYAFLDGQLMVGLAARSAALTLSTLSDGGELGTFSHTGPELGAILGLASLPFRVGLAARTAVEAKNNKVRAPELMFTPPASVVLPEEAQIGFAYQFGDRPLNRRWENPHERERELRNAILLRRLQREQAQLRKERAERLRDAAGASRAAPLGWLERPVDPEFWRAEGKRLADEQKELRRVEEIAHQQVNARIRALSRKYLLLSGDLLYIGTTAEGIGLESFLTQRRQDAGRNPSLSFRFGAEGEPIPNRLRMRVGTYLEPSRFAGIESRLHGTIGGDIKLFSFDLFGLVSEFDWRVTTSLDLAVNYRSIGVSVGIWH